MSTDEPFDLSTQGPMRVRKAVYRHKTRWQGCIKCGLGTHAAKHVLYRGSLPCDLVFIGEGPGKTEDVIGQPFVGPAGKILNIWIERAKVRQPFRFAITNLVACRPCDGPGCDNRPPSQEEREACEPRLSEFFTLARPAGCVLLGRQAESYRTKVPVGWILTLPHPAYVLRQGGESCAEHAECIKLLENFVWQLGRRKLL